LPAVREAAGVAPRQSLDRADLERRARHGVKVLAVGGLVAALLGGLVLVLGSGLVAGFGGIFAVMMAFAAVVPLIVVIATRLLGRLPGAPLWWRLCVRGAGAAISRTGIAVAALTVAVAAVIGVSVMIDSFRASVADWLERTLQADFYVGAPSPMPPAVADRLGAVEGVDYVSRSRFARIPSAQGYTNVRGLALPRAGWSRFELVSGGRESAREAFLSGEGVLVSEPYARQNGVGLGDDVEPLVKGGEPLPIVGIFRDYASVKGVIVMPLATYRALFDDDQLTGVGVHLAAGVAPDSVRSRLAEALTGIAGARLQDNERIRARSLAVFDQTFRVTAVLRLLAGFVAIVGVLGSLMALQLDRAREYATYRALGLTRGQLGAMAFGESGVLGTLAGLCAMALGVLLAALLVFVINRRAFGWTMAFEVGPGPLVGGLALAIGAALVAAVYPAWSIARQSPAAGLKEE
jgi:putative ABC transport system permease protein